MKLAVSRIRIWVVFSIMLYAAAGTAAMLSMDYQTVRDSTGALDSGQYVDTSSELESVPRNDSLDSTKLDRPDSLVYDVSSWDAEIELPGDAADLSPHPNAPSPTTEFSLLNSSDNERSFAGEPDTTVLDFGGPPGSRAVDLAEVMGPMTTTADITATQWNQRILGGSPDWSQPITGFERPAAWDMTTLAGQTGVDEATDFNAFDAYRLQTEIGRTGDLYQASF